MSDQSTNSAASSKKVIAGEKLKGAEKVARIPVKVIPTRELPQKPDWIRVKLPVSPEVKRIKRIAVPDEQVVVPFDDTAAMLGTAFEREVGGEVRTLGQNADGETWRIGVERPDVEEDRVGVGHHRRKRGAALRAEVHDEAR